MLVTEGGVELEVPADAGDGGSAAVTDDVFFNPVQELNRDLTVAVLRAVRDREPRRRSYLDATAATGVRGVRAAANGWDATLCDVDPAAVERCRSNLARNDLEAEVVDRDANALMHERTFDVVDVDPFGTPMPFADAACRAATDFLCVTATDTAPLCGAHFESGVRSYWTVPRNTEYHAEVGLRVLLSALIRTAARYDLAATPVCSYATRHYARTYLRLFSGARAADERIASLGYVYHCEHCLSRESDRGLIADPPARCPNCGEPIGTAGPLWLGETADQDVLSLVRDRVDDGMGTADAARNLLDTLAAELPLPTHYDQHRLCKRWGRSAARMDAFLDRLRDAGFEASRTHYGGTTFKTPASVSEIRAATGD
jgi:tRNA (guanine26-N2/guanine27-N2)-dimethyltransferase